MKIKNLIVIFLSSILSQSCGDNEALEKVNDRNTALVEFRKYCKTESTLEGNFKINEYFDEDNVDYIFEAVEKAGKKRSIIISIKDGEVVDQIKTSE